MKTNLLFWLVSILPWLPVSASVVCPDPPINDDPCFLSNNPPLDLSVVKTHEGTTCCARGPQDMNEDGSPADFANVDCSENTGQAAVWYRFKPDSLDAGYTIHWERTILDAANDSVSMEVYWGDENQACEGFSESVASACFKLFAKLDIKGCTQTGEELFIKISTNNSLNACGGFILWMTDMMFIWSRLT